MKRKRNGFKCLIILIVLCSITQNRLIVKAEGNIKEASAKEEKVHIYVDNNNTYDGMNAAFSNGYLPVVQDGKAEIIVPFTADGEIREDAITVSVDLGDSKSAPFVFKKYERTVRKQVYTFGENEVEVYLFQTEIDLLEYSTGGQYPVILYASGYDTGGNEITMSCTVYIKIEGSSPPAETGEDPESESKDIMGGAGENEPEYVPVSSFEAGSAETEQILHGPRFMLSADNVNGTRIQAGEKIELQAEFVNKSDKYTVYNLKVTVSCNDENLLLSSGSYYESSVAPGGSFSVSDEIDITLNTEQGTKTLTYEFMYEDKAGTAYSDTAEIRFVVYQPVKAELKAFQLAETVTATETYLVDMQLANESRASIYNVAVSLEGDGLKPVGDTFLGNIEAGSVMEGNMKLFVSALGNGDSYGKTTGIITVQYEDAYGTVYKETYDCSTNIQEPQIVAFQLEAEAEATNQWWISIASIAALLLLMIIVLCFFKIKRLTKEERPYESPDAG